MTILRTNLGNRRRLGSLSRQRRLGQDDTIIPYTPANYSATDPTFSDASGGFTDTNPLSSTYGLTLPSTGYGTAAVPGSISAQDAALLSTAITAAGKVGTQAIIGTPTLTYNPATGTYTATGGATVPTSLALNSEIESYLPLILLAGGIILVVSMMGKR